jgi:hypothetical protein
MNAKFQAHGIICDVIGGVYSLTQVSENEMA